MATIPIDIMTYISKLKLYTSKHFMAFLSSYTQIKRIMGMIFMEEHRGLTGLK